METQLKKPSTNSVGNWTVQEDEVILKYVYEKGKGDEHMMWGNLSETLNGRSGKSCRERWFNHLDPKIKRTEWSQEEQWVLFILRNQSNEKWSLISKKLMGRTDNAVKNYWNSRLKKRIDSMQHAVNQHFERKKRQKISTLFNLNVADQQKQQDLNELLAKLSTDQARELDSYMERIKTEYLQKILEQVNLQNMEYFENLACEYTLQLQLLESGQQDPLRIKSFDESIQAAFHKNAGDGEQTSEEAIAYAKFMSKPDIIKMHLDILFKSISFLNKDKINMMLNDYRDLKQQKQREEEERQQMQHQLRKLRGRTSGKKRNDEFSLEFEHESPEQEDKIDERPPSADVKKCIFSEIKPLNHNSSHLMTRSKRSNSNPAKAKEDSLPKPSKQEVQPFEAHCEAMVNPGMNEDSMASSVSNNSRKSKKQKKSAVLRRILKKLQKQKTQSKRIEKIFQSEKLDRSQLAERAPVDPYIVRPPIMQSFMDVPYYEQQPTPGFRSSNLKAHLNITSFDDQHVSEKTTSQKDKPQIRTRLQEKKELLNKPKKTLIKKKKKSSKTAQQRDGQSDREQENKFINTAASGFGFVQEHPSFVNNTNNYYNSNCQVQYNNYENFTQNIYIQHSPVQNNSSPWQFSHVVKYGQFVQAPSPPMHQQQYYPAQQFQMYKQPSVVINKYKQEETPDEVIVAERADSAGQFTPDLINRGGHQSFPGFGGRQASNNSRVSSFTRRGAKMARPKNNYQTDNFLNRTMTMHNRNNRFGGQQLIRGGSKQAYPPTDTHYDHRPSTSYERQYYFTKEDQPMEFSHDIVHKVRKEPGMTLRSRNVSADHISIIDEEHSMPFK